MSGFYIKEFKVIGSNVANASIGFTKGANLVTGASDTGKSYVFAAIEYALGGTEPPKDITESVGYTDILMEIKTYVDDKSYTLHRKIGNNKIQVKSCSIELFDTSSAEQKEYTTTGGLDNNDHISTYLLSLSNLKDKRLLYNKNSGVTRNLSFKNLRKLTHVDEQRIITTESPFYFSNQYTDRTLAQSLLSLLMTGVDYSDTVEKEDKKNKETRINGKLEFLTAQVAQLAIDKELLIEKLSKISPISDQNYLQLDTNLKSNLAKAKQLLNDKNLIVQLRQALTEEVLYKQELLGRFKILKKQYSSDIERLEFILESDVLSSQMGDTVCPICSSPLNNDHLSHIIEQDEFRNSAQKELSKNKSKLAGLEYSITTLSDEIRSLNAAISIENEKLKSLENDLLSNFSPQINSAKEDLKDFLEFEKDVNQISFIDEQIKKLHIEKARLEALLKLRESIEETNMLPYTILAELSENIQDRLEKWNYEPYVKVDFNSDYKIFDIVISGKNRKSYGKGKRSISYAACLFGLLDYSSTHNNFVNLLVLDSPLTTFEEKKKKVTDEALSTEVLKSFYLDFVNLPDNSQIIIFDNKEPDAQTYLEVSDKLNMQVFTGTDQGRMGFFPS